MKAIEKKKKIREKNGFKNGHFSRVRGGGGGGERKNQHQ